jgi:PAS domain S-box-containing protein
MARLRTGEIVRFEVEHRHRDGHVFPLEVSASIVAPGGKEIIQAFHRDITERKRAERALQERVKELRCLHDISAMKLLPDISFPALMEGIVELIPAAWLFPSITAARITLERETFQTKNFRETPWIQACEIVVLGRPAGRLEVCYLEEQPASDEGPFLLQERSLLNTIAERIGSICARQQAEEALAATAERLSMATRAGGVGIWDYDVVNNRLVWDDQMYRLYGITQSNFGGAYESWQAGLHPEDRQRAVETIQLALRGEKEFDSEFRVLWPDGTIRHLHAYAVVQRNVSGQPLRMIGTNWDITTHHRLEVLQKELEAKSQQFQKSESLGRMAGAIAHHFNNQLQVVRLNLELAASNRPETAEPDQGLSTAMQATRKAAEVSSQMLTYLGQSQVGQETLNLAEICRQSLALLKSTLPPCVVLEADLPSTGPGVHANGSQIKQVLMNLITNAWESSGDGRGAIRLSVKTASAAEILAADHFPLDWQPQATAYACLEVADTGAGITAAKIQNIFDPFYSTKFIGRGLGLSVVLGIMRSHDGVVTVESEPSRGASSGSFSRHWRRPCPQNWSQSS